MIAEWELKPGNVARAKMIIDQYRPRILAFEKTRLFLFGHDNNTPNYVLFYEVYESEDGYNEHANSEAFQRYIVQ